MEKSERLVFVDYLRVVACLMVMFVHASENFYAADASGLAGNVSLVPCEANRFWVAFYDGGVARTCVPLFIMVSAFLLVPLRKGTTMLGFYKRRFLRIIPPMVFFMLLYCFLPLLWGGMSLEQSITDLKNLPFNFPSMAGHLWFMYPLISIYLIMPVVSPWLEKASARDERVFLYLFALSTFIPWLQRYVLPEVWGECFWSEYHMLWYCSGYLGFLVMAHYIHNHITWDVRKRLRIGSACFILGAAFTVWSFWFRGIPGQLIETRMLEWAWEFCMPNILVATFGAFLLFTCIGKNRASKFITSLSKLTFAMYLMHLFFLAPIARLIVNGNQAEPIIPVWAAIPVIALATYLCCMITAKIISCIPGLRRLAGIEY